MKSVLVAIQPYWVFLIIAKTMGWKIDQEKTVEVRKNFPKDLNWNKKAIIYCSKNRQSFNRIPKKYQHLMERFLGKVIGDFVCDKICEQRPYKWREGGFEGLNWKYNSDFSEISCVSQDELMRYGNRKTLYACHITDLVIYDKPKELGEFKHECNGICVDTKTKKKCDRITVDGFSCNGLKPVERPPQSWCYVKELGV